VRAWFLGPLLAFSCAIAAAQPVSNNSQQATVIIRQMHFDPAQLSVKPGETVTWRNDDIFTHTVTANDASFDSGPIAPGTSWQHTFAVPATVGYHCRPHPNMAASLIVGGAPAQNASLRWKPPTAAYEIHPILVNFTAALLPLAFFSDLLGRLLRRSSLHKAAWWLTLYAAIITPLTAAAGWWWRHSAGSSLPPRLITVHAWLGSFAALAFLALAAWRWQLHKSGSSPSWSYLSAAFILVLALVYQGSLGGRMVFGN
jgi:plastocyanin/uncharacterized membrane protein